MKNEFQSGTSYVPSFRTGSTDVNTIQHRYFQELEKDCSAMEKITGKNNEIIKGVKKLFTSS